MNTSTDAMNTDNHSEVNEENFKLKPITPEGIFSFACHPRVSCFNKCCHEIDVILTPVDILKMKTALNIRSDEFLKKYTTLQTIKDTGIPLVKLLMRENSKGACIFLNESKGCSIYQNRPQVCRSYPLGLGALDPRHAKLQTEGQSPDARFMIQEDMCMGHQEPKTWTLKKWMEDQGAFTMEELNKPWMEIVAKLKAMKITDKQNHEINLFIMASYDLDTFWNFVFESSFLQRFVVDEITVENIKSTETELLKFGMEWLQYALFGEGSIRPKVN